MNTCYGKTRAQAVAPGPAPKHIAQHRPCSTQDVLPSAIPGFVLGGLALLGFCFTLAAVLLSLCCRCCRRRTGTGTAKQVGSRLDCVRKGLQGF